MAFSRHSIRVPLYNYTLPGFYFVTLVTSSRAKYFGDVLGDGVRLSQVGNLVQKEWLRLERRFKHLRICDYVIMPNHLHGILELCDDDGHLEKSRGTGLSSRASISSTQPRAPTVVATEPELPQSEEFGKPVPGSIPTIIRSFKASVSYRVKFLEGWKDLPLWQRNYFERIIRNEQELTAIYKYIEGNPRLWTEDLLYR